ncbi:uncharacterized protein LOC110823846 [Carica papaya]|uniref:uncharacterized protein LOC110823846 n=1 Tax=Carica papaya TaxID=3649 RepID=UPI000B8C9B84|nr:uncharacterized protein LOC110823846 [Carica papaya]
MEQKTISSADESNKRVEMNGEKGILIHSQVMKIKREFEKIKHPSLQQTEIRRVLLPDINRQRSPSPLGSISVGN